MVELYWGSADDAPQPSQAENRMTLFVTPTLATTISATARPTSVSALNELHRDVADTLAGLSISAADDFLAGYQALLSKLERIFSAEELWMEDTGFPALKHEMEQHGRILSALHHVHSKVLGGDLAAGREVVDALLPQWFTLHLTAIDKTLSMSIHQVPAAQDASIYHH